MTRPIPILLYHDLASPELESEKQGPSTRSTIVQASDFNDQMRYLHENGYRTIPLTELLDRRIFQRRENEKTVAVTFDDGHWSGHRLAVPVLERYGLQATFFIIANRIGAPFHVDAEHIRHMRDRGMEIGSHGLTHDHLPEMSPDDIRHELVESKSIIEGVMDHPVDFFAPSGGHTNAMVRGLIADAGYRGACSTRVGLNGPRTDRFGLKRIEIRAGFTTRDFARVFSKKHLIRLQAVDRFKQTIKGAIGLERYRRLRSRFFRFYPFIN